jgi:hypothetical protein
MAVPSGVIMAADRRIGNDDPKIRPVLKRKLFTIGNNIGVGFLCHCEKLVIYDHFNEYCRHNFFINTLEAAKGIIDFIKDYYARVLGSLYAIQIAGYTESGLQSFTYTIDYKHGQEIVERKNPGFYHYGCASGFIQQYEDMVNKSAFIQECSLQEAADWSLLMHQIGRGMTKFICSQDIVSDEIDVMSITPDGIQWLRKQELEVKL